jgi:CheY-like chemotaxis protein
MSRLLVVEDDVNVLELLQSLLAEEGYHVTACRSALDARATMEQSAFDLLVADYVMKDEDGLSLAEHAQSRGIRAVVMTADHTKLPLLQGSGLPVIAKPFRVQELMKVVASVLSPSN